MAAPRRGQASSRLARGFGLPPPAPEYQELHSLKQGRVVLKCFITKLLLKNAQHVNSNWNDKR